MVIGYIMTVASSLDCVDVLSSKMMAKMGLEGGLTLDG